MNEEEVAFDPTIVHITTTTTTTTLVFGMQFCVIAKLGS